MSKKPTRSFKLILAAVVMIGASLACSLDDTDDITPEDYSATCEAKLEAASDQPDDEPPPEACIVKKGEGYSWENTDHRIVEGDGVTSCTYRFIVRNTSDEDQHLIIYETNSTGSDGMQWEGWNVRHLGAHGSYEADYSYTDYYGRGGDYTWGYATSLLIVRKVPECFWLIPSDDPNNLGLWEQHAVSPDNPCR